MKKILKVVKIFIIVIVILLMVTNCVSFLSDDHHTFHIFGYKPYVVLSDSMNPTFRIDDVVVSKTIDCDQLKVGDVITFFDGSSMVTHRIVEIEDYQGTLKFTTKGDNNNVNDEDTITEEQIAGKMMFVIPRFGKVLAFLGNKMVLFFFICILALTCFIPKNKEEEIEVAYEKNT